MSETPYLRRFLWWIGDLPIRVESWLLDQIAGPYPETEADRIREQRTEPLCQTFPDPDHRRHAATPQESPSGTLDFLVQGAFCRGL